MRTPLRREPDRCYACAISVRTFIAGSPLAADDRGAEGADREIGAGELVGLVGENGLGKSTLMQIVVGLLSSDGGEIERPSKLGYCPQAPMVWGKVTVAEHFQLFARAYDLDEEGADRTEVDLLNVI